jgi:hypothetical protein
MTLRRGGSCAVPERNGWREAGASLHWAGASYVKMEGSRASSARSVLLAAACSVAACSVSHQGLDLTLRADPVLTDPQGRQLGPRAREAVGKTLERQLTAGFPCADDGTGACTKRVRITPITAQLGQPPDPAEIALRMAPSGPTDEVVRGRVRRAYGEAVRTRYRIYADYLADQLWDADWIEVSPATGYGPTRRYGRPHIAEGLEETLTDMADGYTALEWARFEREWARGPVAVRARPPRAARASPTPARTAPPPTEEAGGAPAAPLPAEPPKGAAGTPPAQAAGAPASSTAATPASAPTAAVDDVPCRRSCSLRYRACLARCRDQPVSGGEYDACTYECSGSALTCRNTCGARAAP